MNDKEEGGFTWEIQTMQPPKCMIAQERIPYTKLTHSSLKW
jgi:hypothetical protein